LVDGFEREVRMKLFTFIKELVVRFRLEVMIVLLERIATFEPILPKRAFTVIFFEVGVPFGLSIIRRRSSDVVDVSDVS
jgi:hypothetical protein